MSDPIYTRELADAALAGFAITFEARRLEVGFAQARTEILAAALSAMEAVFFDLGGPVESIPDIVVGLTARRIAQLPTARLELSAEATKEMQAKLCQLGYK